MFRTVTHSLVFLKMGKIIARNTLSWLELLISRYCCIYFVVYIIYSSLFFFWDVLNNLNLTLILKTWRIWWAPKNACKCRRDLIRRLNVKVLRVTAACPAFILNKPSICLHLLGVTKELQLATGTAAKTLHFCTGAALGFNSGQERGRAETFEWCRQSL